MPYQDDALASQLSKFFELRGDRYYFVRRYGELPVSDEDLWLASETLRERGMIGKVLNFLLIVPTVMFLFWYWTTGHKVGWLWALFPVAIVLGQIAYSCIIYSVLRPFKQKLMQGWRRRGFRGAFASVGKSRGQLLLCMAILTAISGTALYEYLDRSALERSGQVANAIVVPSAEQTSLSGKHKCMIAYRFEWSGRSYETVLKDCDVEKQHPPGSRIDVYIDPQAPAHSFPAQDAKWPSIMRIVLGLMAMFALLFFWLAADRVPPGPERP